MKEDVSETKEVEKKEVEKKEVEKKEMEKKEQVKKRRKRKRRQRKIKQPVLRLSVATRRLSSDQKLLSRNFDDDTVKADSIRSMRGIAESASTISIGSDSSGSESCLSDEEVTKPHDSLPVVKEGYLVKHAISSRSFFNSARKRYFRLTLDERQKISFLSYYNDDESEEAKGHLILADGCQVTMKSKGKSSSLRVTFYDDIKDAKEKEERDKKHTLILNQTESEILKIVSSPGLRRWRRLSKAYPPQNLKPSPPT